MFRFNKNYFLLTIFLFLVEVLIALYVHDNFVRPYVGDFLVVILLYCFTRSFLHFPGFTTGVVILAFSFCIELAQYFDVVSLLRLQNNKIARTVIGTSFEWTDLVAYTLGIVFVLGLETYFPKTSPPRPIN